MASFCSSAPLTICQMANLPLERDCNIPAMMQITDTMWISEPLLIIPVISSLLHLLIMFKPFRQFEDTSGFGEHSFAFILHFFATGMVFVARSFYMFTDGLVADIIRFLSVVIVALFYFTILWAAIYDIGFFQPGCVSPVIGLVIGYIVIFVLFGVLIQYDSIEFAVYLFIIIIFLTVILWTLSTLANGLYRDNGLVKALGGVGFFFWIIAFAITAFSGRICDSSIVSGVSLGAVIAEIAFWVHFYRTWHMKDDEDKADQNELLNTLCLCCVGDEEAD